MKILFAGLSIVLSLHAAYAGCDASAEKLKKAYSQIVGCTNNHIIWKDGTKMLYDDGRSKSFEALLNSADIEDMFHYGYPKGAAGYGRGPKKNFDPGRIRNEKFFRHMYGNSAKDVKKHLRTIRWMPESAPGPVYIKVTTVNSVDKKLEKVSKDLDSLCAKKPGYKKYLIPLGGSFKWRVIAGTKRLSVHSFGAAIDINVKYAAYWRWSKGSYRYRNQIPIEIVKIFEKHGFIWGGKWYHYDTMHFEYRPELLI